MLARPDHGAVFFREVIERENRFGGIHRRHANRMVAVLETAVIGKVQILPDLVFRHVLLKILAPTPGLDKGLGKLKTP